MVLKFNTTTIATEHTGTTGPRGDNLALFGISIYGIWTVGYFISCMMPRGDDESDAENNSRGRYKCFPDGVRPNQLVAFSVGTVSYAAGLYLNGFFDILGWGHWLLMFFVNMLGFRHIAMAADIGRRRTIGIIAYSSIPFAIVLVAKASEAVQEMRTFILCSGLLLLVPIKRIHASWYRDYDTYDSDAPAGMARVLGLLLLWISQIILCAMGDDVEYQSRRGYQLAADVVLLFIVTDGAWESWD